MNTERDYLDYLWSIEALDSILGIRTIDFYVKRDVLFPYITKIIRYIIDNIYLELGSNGTIEEKISLVELLFDTGASKICSKRAKELAEEVLGELTENYDQDRFVFCWSNVMSTILMRLRVQNPVKEDKNQECSCCCSRSEDWEDFVSGVYPEDENYEDEKLIINTETSPCGCSYRK